MAITRSNFFQHLNETSICNPRSNQSPAKHLSRLLTFDGTYGNRISLRHTSTPWDYIQIGRSLTASKPFGICFSLLGIFFNVLYFRQYLRRINIHTYIKCAMQKSTQSKFKIGSTERQGYSRPLLAYFYHFCPQSCIFATNWTGKLGKLPKLSSNHLQNQADYCYFEISAFTK